MPGHALLDGEPAPEGAYTDRACQFGDGLFETLAVVDGQPCLWQLHAERLSKGCARLGLPRPDTALLLDEARRLCAGRERGVLKIVLSAGRSLRGYARDPNAVPVRWLQCMDWPKQGALAHAMPLRLYSCRLRLAHQPRLAGIKHLNRLEQVLARSELPPEADEGVLCDSQGYAVEAIAANLLVYLDGRWLTPPLDECGVAGTVRRLLLASALPVEVEPLPHARLFAADGLFLTSALLGVRPVASLDGHAFALQQRPPVLEAVHRAAFRFAGETVCNA